MPRKHRSAIDPLDYSCPDRYLTASWYRALRWNRAFLRAYGGNFQWMDAGRDPFAQNRSNFERICLFGEASLEQRVFGDIRSLPEEPWFEPYTPSNVERFAAGEPRDFWLTRPPDGSSG